MKTILLIVCFPFLVLTCLAQYGVETLTNPGGITQVATGQTTNVYSTCSIDTRKTANTAMLLSFKLAGAGTGNVTLTFAKTIETATTPAVGDVFTWVVAANGTSTVNVETNIATGGYGWLQLASIANAGGDTLTNIVLKYSNKKL